MIDFIRIRWLFGLISFGLLFPCVLALAVWQLNPGIDFEGGIELEVRFLGPQTEAEVLEAVNATSFPAITVETTDDDTYLLTVPVPADAVPQEVADDTGQAIDDALGTFIVEDFDVDDERVESEFWFPADVAAEDVRDVLDSVGQGRTRVQGTSESSYKFRAQDPDDGDVVGLQNTIGDALAEEFGRTRVLRAEAVSGVLSSEIARNAGIALVIAALAILIYIWFSFRLLPKPWLYGTAAIIALVHDVVIVVGIFSILGEVIDLEVNAMFVTALLAVIGYSVNDTIVVFDRLRENLLRLGTDNLRQTLNAAITETLGRSLNTSITLGVALLALVLIGGVTIRPFALVLLVGAIAGTYSSIGVASQMVVLWEEGTIGRWLRLGRSGTTGEAPIRS